MGPKRITTSRGRGRGRGRGGGGGRGRGTHSRSSASRRSVIKPAGLIVDYQYMDDRMDDSMDEKVSIVPRGWSPAAVSSTAAALNGAAAALNGAVAAVAVAAAAVQRERTRSATEWFDISLKARCSRLLSLDAAYGSSLEAHSRRLNPPLPQSYAELRAALITAAADHVLFDDRTRSATAEQANILEWMYWRMMDLLSIPPHLHAAISALLEGSSSLTIHERDCAQLAFSWIDEQTLFVTACFTCGAKRHKLRPRPESTAVARRYPAVAAAVNAIADPSQVAWSVAPSPSPTSSASSSAAGTPTSTRKRVAVSAPTSVPARKAPKANSRASPATVMDRDLLYDDEGCQRVPPLPESEEEKKKKKENHPNLYGGSNLPARDWTRLYEELESQKYAAPPRPNSDMKEFEFESMATKSETAMRRRREESVASALGLPFEADTLTEETSPLIEDYQDQYLQSGHDPKQVGSLIARWTSLRGLLMEKTDKFITAAAAGVGLVAIAMRPISVDPARARYLAVCQRLIDCYLWQGAITRLISNRRKDDETTRQFMNRALVPKVWMNEQEEVAISHATYFNVLLPAWLLAMFAVAQRAVRASDLVEFAAAHTLIRTGRVGAHQRGLQVWHQAQQLWIFYEGPEGRSLAPSHLSGMTIYPLSELSDVPDPEDVSDAEAAAWDDRYRPVKNFAYGLVRTIVAATRQNIENAAFNAAEDIKELTAATRTTRTPVTIKVNPASAVATINTKRQQVASFSNATRALDDTISHFMEQTVPRLSTSPQACSESIGSFRIRSRVHSVTIPMVYLCRCIETDLLTSNTKQKSPLSTNVKFSDEMEKLAKEFKFDSARKKLEQRLSQDFKFIVGLSEALTRVDIPLTKPLGEVVQQAMVCGMNLAPVADANSAGRKLSDIIHTAVDKHKDAFEKQQPTGMSPVQLMLAAVIYPACVDAAAPLTTGTGFPELRRIGVLESKVIPHGKMVWTVRELVVMRATLPHIAQLCEKMKNEVNRKQMEEIIAGIQPHIGGNQPFQPSPIGDPMATFYPIRPRHAERKKPVKVESKTDAPAPATAAPVATTSAASSSSASSVAPSVVADDGIGPCPVCNVDFTIDGSSVCFECALKSIPASAALSSSSAEAAAAVGSDLEPELNEHLCEQCQYPKEFGTRALCNRCYEAAKRVHPFKRLPLNMASLCSSSSSS